VYRRSEGGSNVTFLFGTIGDVTTIMQKIFIV